MAACIRALNTAAQGTAALFAAVSYLANAAAPYCCICLGVFMHETDHGHTALRLPSEDSVEAMLSSHPSTRTAIVFVHGFAGNAVSTWAQFQRLVDEVALDDAWWRTADLFFYGYSSVLQTANQSAADLLSFLNRVYPSPNETFFRAALDAPESTALLGSPEATAIRGGPYAYEELVLVGHSEGGVVLRLALRELVREHERLRRHSAAPMADGMQGLLRRAEAERWDADQWVAGVRALSKMDDAGPKSPILRAALRLFAPAISGAAPSGIVGFLYNSFVGAAVRPLLSSASAFNDLQPGSPVLVGLRAETERYAERYPELRALPAHILWGWSDGIITDEAFAPDRYETLEQHSHTSVCKPTPHYRKPLDFVQRGLE